jgi:hypothetical protein
MFYFLFERNLMRRLVPFFTAAVAGCLVFGCSAPKPEAPVEINPTFTVRDVMKSIVQPGGDVLWNAVSTSVTEKGPETKAPKNDEEWQAVRNSAISLIEAGNLILIPGRKIANAGEQAKDPKVELNPDQIEALINKDRATWVKLVHDFQNSVAPALKAIDAKNADELSNAGGLIDSACETCHKMYWYPNEGKANADAKPEEKK